MLQLFRPQLERCGRQEEHVAESFSKYGFESAVTFCVWIFQLVGLVNDDQAELPEPGSYQVPSQVILKVVEGGLWHTFGIQWVIAVIF